VNSDQSHSDSLFRKEDRLLLLQLQTRRAMAERRARQVGGHGAGEDTEQARPEKHLDATIPGRWHRTR
jgi:hypothetical protein